MADHSRVQPNSQAPFPSGVRASLRFIAPLVGLLVQGVLPHHVQAQFSPHCRLNGKEVFCAMTSYGPGSDGWQKTTVVLADDRTIKLHHNERNCRQGKPESERICPARLKIVDSKGSRSFFGSYRLQTYEGGVTHQYEAGPVNLQFFYMD